MNIKIVSLVTNFPESSTIVSLEIYENIGSIERLKDRLNLKLYDKFDTITDALYDAIYAELEKNGFNLNSPTE
jgi:predicted RNase H-like nuclease (RuvC/YqgF family)